MADAATPSRRIVADGQVFQTAAWHRGMGKYSLELLCALGAADPTLELEIVVSARVETPESFRSTLTERLPRARVVSLELMRDQPGAAHIAEHNRVVLAEYLGSTRQPGQPVEFVVLSSMQGGIKAVFPAVAGVSTSAIVYDLIPLMFHDTYLRFAEAQSEYQTRIGELLRADRYLTISKTVANDLAVHLGVDPSRISNIDGGPIMHASAARRVETVREPFVLMPTGNDLRKNNRRAVRGFGRFNESRGNRYSLVVTSTFRPDEIAALGALAPHVVFTGNLDGDELADLYQRAEALLFPPEYEGLGLPILEAVEAGKPVACSDIPVFREISDAAFQFFDPLSIVEIATAIGRAVDQQTVDEDVYRAVIARYTWPHVAQRLLASTALPAPRSRSAPQPVVVVGPDPATDDRVGKAILHGHAELSRHHQLSYVFEDGAAATAGRANYLPYVVPTQRNRPGLTLGAGVAVHHLANTASCGRTLFTALGQPGVVILYDTALDEAWQVLVDAHLVSASRIEAEQRIEQAVRVPGTAHLATLLAGQKAAVVFDDGAAARVADVAAVVNPSLRVDVVPAGVSTVVHPEVLPHKTILLSRLDGDARPLNFDFRTAETVSRSQVVSVPACAGVHGALEVMRFGTVPCVDDAPGLPADALVRTSGHSPEEAARRLLENPADYAAASARAFEHATTQHGQGAFAQRLAALIDDVAKDLGIS